MNTMVLTTLKLVIGVGLVFLLTPVPSAVVHAQSNSDSGLSQREIIEKSKDAYAALSSYSDEGKVITTGNGPTRVGLFTTRLSRPYLYLIEWKPSASSPAETKTKNTKSMEIRLWSAGDGDFSDRDGRSQRLTSQEKGVTDVVPWTEGDTVHITRLFFSRLENVLKFDYKRQPDEKVGEVDCFVFEGGTKDEKRTLWIGKQDFLIRQVRTVDSLDIKQPDSLEIRRQIITSVETHSNIVLNQKFSVAAFVPSNAR
jgi:outer membrane lipoprotein-sorting protein